MLYWLIGVLAILIHLIVNSDIIRNNGRSRLPARNEYCLFLYSVIAYHTSDALWGIINDTRNAPLLYADTVIYFVLMALSVLLWSNFVTRYLEREDQVEQKNDRLGRVLNIVGKGFFAFQIAALLVNIVVPLLFSVDWSGEYHAGVLRHITFLIQMGMFLFTSAYALSISRKTEGAVKRRHRTIALLGLAMSIAIAIQLYFPLLPMYSIGYMLGCCALHTFVVEDEKAEYLLALEESIQREGKQRKELSAVRSKAYSDPLTGVKSKHAYMDAADYIHRRIMAGDVKEFAVAVFDLNGLKQVNDTQGHDAGDQYIKEGCSLICEVFSHSPVYRIGGDEFVAIMEGRDYENRAMLLDAFDGLMEHNKENGLVVISEGISEFDPEHDETYSAVFQRADKKMYERKKFLKGQDAEIR